MIILTFPKKLQSTNVRNEGKRGREYKQFKIIRNRGQEAKSTK